MRKIQPARQLLLPPLLQPPDEPPDQPETAPPETPPAPTVECSRCNDTGHTAPNCRCVMKVTGMIYHIERCVIPCDCAAGRRLEELIDLFRVRH